MTVITTVFLNRPLALLEPYSGGELIANDIISGQVILRWANTIEGYAVGQYVSFYKEDVQEVKRNGGTYYLIDESKILFSFTVLSS